MSISPNESGRSLIEMLAVISIISIITVGAVNGLGYANRLFRATEIQNDVEALASGVIDLYSWQRDYNNLNMTTICDNDILMRDCVNNAFPAPGADTIIVQKTGGGDSFEIVVTGLPRLTCNALKDKKWIYVQAPTEACNGDQNTLSFAAN